MTREERKQFTIEKKLRIKEEKKQIRQENKTWNDLIRRMTKKDALLEIN